MAKELLSAKQLIKKMDEFPADHILHNSYIETFGDSEFFDPNVYEQVLKLRTLVDEIALEKPLISDLITIAALSALVPASRMKRAGDLRYKTVKEACGFNLVVKIDKTKIQSAVEGTELQLPFYFKGGFKDPDAETEGE